MPPSFMNQRQIPPGRVFSARPKSASIEDVSEVSPETKIFDRAEKVIKVRILRDDIARLKAGITEDKLELENAEKEQKAHIKTRMPEAGERIKLLEKYYRQSHRKSAEGSQ